MFPVASVRSQFPILNTKINGNPLIYFDNAATSQKPQCVIDRMTQFYQAENANVFRGVHTLSGNATVAFEAARSTVAQFLGTAPQNIVLVRGATEAINLVAHGFYSVLQPGDEILISVLEHHANLIPWQALAQATGATLVLAPILPNSNLDYAAFSERLSRRTKIVAITHLSNVTGSIIDVRTITAEAHKVGATVLIDAAQSATHFDINVTDIDCDFLVFSGHKIYGPTGIGVLYGKTEALDSLPPLYFGGEMIDVVTPQQSTYRKPPARFEAGTPPIAGALGLKAALDFLMGLDRAALLTHEHQLLESFRERLLASPYLEWVALPTPQAPIVTFSIKGAHPHDLGTVLDQSGIAVRTGKHCAHPLMQVLGQEATIRVSFGLYNTLAEVEAFFTILPSAIQYLSKTC